MSINRCDICYVYKANSCLPYYNIYTGLEGGNIYSMILETPNGECYVTDIEMPIGGGFQIDVTAYPDGMFNQWSGSYEIWFTDGGIDGEQQTLTINGKEYPCILMTFYNTTFTTGI